MIKYKLLKKEDHYSTKISICLNSKLNEYAQKGHNYEIFSNFSEISLISKNVEYYLIYFIYLYRKNIHKILYDDEANLNIESKKENITLFYMFYLSLLINENSNIINYRYSFDYIDSINQHNIKKNEKLVFKKIIIAKIIIELINNYKNDDEYDEDNEKLNNIEKENIDIIKNNINIVTKLTLDLDGNYFKEKKIDMIYIDIIKAVLLKNKNFNNIENIEQILNQLELESINITNDMLTELLIILNDDSIKEYMIENINDLFNINKINFYFILFKYIIKNSILIYKIPFLLKTKKFIINIIKNKIDDFPNFNIEINKKIEYVLERITDSKYYYIKILNLLKNVFSKIELKNECIIKQKNYGVIDSIENIIMRYFLKNNKKLFIKILKKDIYECFTKKKKNINNKEKIQKINNNNDESIHSTLSNGSLGSNNNNQSVNKEYERINLNNIKQVEISSYNEENAKQISVNSKDNKICNENPIEKNSDDSSKNSEDKEIQNQEGINEASNDSSYFRREIQPESDEEEENEESEKIIDNSNYQILEFEEIIYKKRDSSKSNNEIINPKIVYYDIYNNIFISEEKKLIEKIQKINYKECINCIEDLEANLSNQIIIVTKQSFYIINSETNKKEKIEFKESDIKINSFFKVKNKNNENNPQIILIKENEIWLVDYSFSKIIGKDYSQILKGYYKEGIQIDKFIFAFTSNKIASGGEDKITFCNINTKKPFNIRNNSLILSTTGLYLMSLDNDDNNKILLCACKKYIKAQKNGILLISDLKNIDKSNYDIKRNIKFYNTKGFEVHCFCQISIIVEENLLTVSKTKKTNYFFVGGFDTKKYRGGIKLYKIKKNNEEIIEIEKIQDIVLKNEYEFKNKNNLFKGPISCIKQSKNDIKILIITCWDGNVYLFKNPNIEKFISIESNIDSIF